MNSPHLLLSISILVATLAHTTLAENPTAKGKERIGVYDSRSVAVAYGGSQLLKDRMHELKARETKAKEAGDAKEVAKLDAEGAAMQERLHKQGFSTAPVDDLLALIAAELPRIKQAAGVASLVSKWNKADLEKHPSAERVDVTTQLIDAFHPDATARKNALEIQEKKPLP